MHRVRLTLSALVLLAAATAAWGFISVNRTEHATGRDGYYYLVQMKSLLEEGRMHSPEYSPVYAPLLLIQLITDDYTAAYRIGTVLFKVLFVLSVYCFSRSVIAGKRRESDSGAEWIPLLTAALSAASPSLNYFFTQFPKNMLGFAMFLYFSAMVTSAGRCPGKDIRCRARVPAAILLFAAAFFTHRFAAVMSLTFLVIYLIPFVVTFIRRKWREAGGRWKYMAAAVIGLMLLALVLLASDRIPLAPSISDLQRVTGDLSASPIFVPASFMESFGSFRMSLPWRIELFAAPLLCLLSLIMLMLRRREFTGLGPGYAAMVIVGMTGLFPFFEFSLTGIAYRLLFATLLLWPLAVIPCIDMLLERLPASAWPKVSAFGVLIVISFFTGGTYDPEIHDPPWGYYRELAGEIVESLQGVDHELIVAHGALAEMITFTYGEDALPWSPEEEFRRDRVWRVTAGILRDEVSYYLSPDIAESLFIDIRGDYGLLREDAWEDFIRAISDDPVMMDAVDGWRNPMETRPSYLVGDRAE